MDELKFEISDVAQMSVEKIAVFSRIASLNAMTKKDILKKIVFSDTTEIFCIEGGYLETAICKIIAVKPFCTVFCNSCFNGGSDKINVVKIFKIINPNTTAKEI